MTARLKILVIEDQEIDYQLLQAHLRREGLDFDARCAGTAAELQAALEDPDWDLVITDHTLPDIDIRSRLQSLMTRLPQAPVIMLSGMIDEQLAVDFLRAGVDDFVSKMDLSRLVPAIRRSLDAVATRAARQVAEHGLQLLDRALAATANGVMITRADDDMPMVYVNTAFSRITGYTADEAIGRNPRFLHRDDTDQEGLHTIRAAFREGQPSRAVVRNYRKDGTPFWSRLGIAPITDSAGRATHYVGVQEDITEQRAREERLRQSAAVFENTAEGVIITDADSRILDVNLAFTQITGYSRDEVLGRNPNLLQSGRHGSEFYQAMWQSLRESGQWRGEIWNRRKGGEIYPEWLTISRVSGADGQLANYVAVFSDISNIKQSEEQLEHLAHHDALTGLPNRLLFNARLLHAIEHAQREGTQVGLLFLDLDRFKNINDSLGHPQGDLLLKQVADRLLHTVRLDDTVARIGGDEFVVLLESIAGPDDAALVADKILASMKQPIRLPEHEQYITCSIGISIYPRDGSERATLLRHADLAMYQVKAQGRNACAFFTGPLGTPAREHVGLENDLHKALENGELDIHYQPQVLLESGQLVGAEALLRWRHPTRGTIPPSLFIPIAEESGLIVDIGDWVIRRVCEQMRRWLDDDLEPGSVAINIAGNQVQRGDLAQRVQQALDSARLPASYLELELTEGSIMGQAERSIAQLTALRELGVSLAIDDFGTGYSSLSYLKRLPVERIKVDRSFVRDIPDDGDDVAITRAVIALGMSLGKEVVAEGVETQQQRQFLLAEGCWLGQGYLFSRPLPAQAFADWMRRQRVAIDADA